MAMLELCCGTSEIAVSAHAQYKFGETIDKLDNLLIINNSAAHYMLKFETLMNNGTRNRSPEV